jgi:hypothetical protein
MTRRMNWALILVVMSAAAQAGDINVKTPLVSGDVERFQDRQETSRRELSRGELQTLSHWLEIHRAEWHAMTEASNETISMRFDLKGNDGNEASISVIAQTNGNYYLQLVSSTGWSYRSFGGFIKSRAASRPLSDKELAVMQKMFGPS